LENLFLAMSSSFPKVSGNNVFALSVGGAAATAAALFYINSNKQEQTVLAAQEANKNQQNTQAKSKLKMKPTGDMAVFTQGASPLDLAESGGKPL
jgi:hypothetical protein